MKAPLYNLRSDEQINMNYFAIKMLFQMCILSWSLIRVHSESNETKVLTVLGFLPITGKGWTGGGACLPASLMATRHVNEKPGLLDGYTLKYNWVDSQVKT